MPRFKSFLEGGKILYVLNDVRQSGDIQVSGCRHKKFLGFKYGSQVVTDQGNVTRYRLDVAACTGIEEKVIECNAVPEVLHVVKGWSLPFSTAGKALLIQKPENVCLDAD